MKQCRNVKKWRLVLGVSAVSILALGVSVQAIDIVHVGAPVPVASEGGSIDLGVLYDNATLARGRSADYGGAVETPVYYSLMPGEERGWFQSLVSTTGYASGIGEYFADNITLGGGFTPGMELSSFEMRIFRSSADPGRSDGTVVVELWDGDPAGLADTPGSEATRAEGYSGLPIPDSRMDFTLPGQDGGYRAWLRGELPKGVVIPHQRVWIVTTYRSDAANPGTCRMGWIFSDDEPTIGAAHLPFIGWQYARDEQLGAGTCCNDEGGDCNPTADPTIGGGCCPGDDLSSDAGSCGGRFFCKDGDAEAGGNSAFDGPNVAMVRMYAKTDSKVALAPVGNDISGGLDPNCSIDTAANEITCQAGGHAVFLEILVDDWDPSPWECGLDPEGFIEATDLGEPCTDTLDCVTGYCGNHLKAYQYNIDASGFTSGLKGTVVPFVPSCASNAECEAVIGEGSKCASGLYDNPAKSCVNAYVDKDRTDWVYYDWDTLGAVDVSTMGSRYGWTVNDDPARFARGFTTYAGSLALWIPADAKGTFSIGFAGGTAMSDQYNQFMVPLGMVPAKLTVPLGSCCYGIGTDPDVSGCRDRITYDQCHDPTGPDVWDQPPYPDVVIFNAGATCSAGCAECTVDGDCGDGDACTVDTCDGNFICQHDKVAIAAETCCNDTANVGDAIDILGAGGHASYATANVCAVGSCSDGGDRGTPVLTAEPAGTACTLAGNAVFASICTYGGECNGTTDEGKGSCIPLNSNNVVCETAADCFDITGSDWDCIDRLCNCVECPALEFRAAPSSKPNSMCYAQGEKIMVDIYVGPSGMINGGQFVIFYDPSCMDFNSISGVDPYTEELYELVDEASGMIFYAVGVNPFGGVGLPGNTNLATISFTKMQGCNNCFLAFGGDDMNPLNTYLVDAEGQNVCVEPQGSAEFHENDQLRLDIPDDDKVNVDCDFSTAMVTWDAPSGSSSCGDADCDPKKDKCYDPNLECWGQHESGLDMTDLAMGGGEHPLGITTYFCTLTSNICGDDITRDWTVTVNDQTSLDVEIQLSPIIAGDITRCIQFEMYSDTVQDPLPFSANVFFGGLFDHVGHFTETIKVPDAGQWVCITARDQLHTLRSCDTLVCGPDGVYSAVFKGDPFFGGNWLIGGNLDAWKKKVVGADPSVHVIDILDFGQFVAQYGAVGDPNTPCDVNGPHADINGDGVVDSLDYSFVANNFLASDKECCGGTAGVEVGRTSITVRELRRLGMADLAVADLNNDGVVDMNDMSAFMAGEVPVKSKTPRDRKGSSLRSR